MIVCGFSVCSNMQIAKGESLAFTSSILNLHGELLFKRLSVLKNHCIFNKWSKLQVHNFVMKICLNFAQWCFFRNEHLYNGNGVWQIKYVHDSGIQLHCILEAYDNDRRIEDRWLLKYTTFLWNFAANWRSRNVTGCFAVVRAQNSSTKLTFVLVLCTWRVLQCIWLHVFYLCIFC